MSESPVLLSVVDGLARITLNRPARMNAFEQSMAHAWAEATAEATSRDDVHAILIDAAGPSFCAGGDVLAMAHGMSDFTIEELAHAINLIEEDPRKAEGVMEHEITALYAKLNYAVNSARVGPQAAEIMDHDDLVAWPASMPFKSQP